MEGKCVCLVLEIDTLPGFQFQASSNHHTLTSPDACAHV